MENEIIKCMRCQRPLKNKEARELGYGKTCYKKMKVSKQYNLLERKVK